MENKILQGDSLDVLKTLPDESVDCIITSPPYFGLRDYMEKKQIGREKRLEDFIDNLLCITLELKRVLKKTGVMFWNHGDSYANRNTTLDGGAQPAQGRGRKGAAGRIYLPDYPEKSLLLQAHRLSIKMIDEQGWVLRNIIIWHKPSCMPSPAKDRFSVDYEPIFFFSKQKRYYFKQQFEPFQSNDYDLRRMAGESKVYNGKWSKESQNKVAVPGDRAHIQKAFVGGSEGGRNKRCVWSINTQSFSDAHFATFPESLVEPMVAAGCPPGGLVLDPFMGSGTTAIVAKKLSRDYLGIELNPDFIKIAEKRISNTPSPLF